MKKVKLLLLVLVASMTVTSCADSRAFEIDGKNEVVQAYGWMNPAVKNDSINYRVCVGNLVWSIVLSETILAPVIITGIGLYEPVSKK
jgi:hypothetical protein